MSGGSFGDLLGDRGAELSACGRYRYSLWRRWDYGQPAVLFVMLNPSTADALVDDPTVRRCIGFARRWGAGGIRICNLYAWRATDPRELVKAVAAGIDPVAEPRTGIRNANDHAISSAAADAARIFAAWGAWRGPSWMRSSEVLELLARYRDVEALAFTKDGSPRHPGRLGYAVTPTVYYPAVRRAA